MDIKIPNSWDDISIGQYIELRPVLAAEMSDIERLIHILAVILRQPTQEVKKIKLKNVKEINKEMSFLWKEELPTELQNIFQIDDQWFEIVLDARELNAGQYMSVSTKLKDVDSDPNVIYSIIHNILASISYPIIENKGKYERQEIDSSYFSDTSKLFYEKLPVSIAYPLGVFFCNLSQDLMPIIQGYSKRKLTKANSIMEEVQKDISKDGDGL